MQPDKALQPVHTSTLARFGLARFDKIYSVNTFKPSRAEPGQACSIEAGWYGSARFRRRERLKKEFQGSMAVVNWSRDEVFKLISLWSEDVIQDQLEGCWRNSQVYKITDGLREAGFSRMFEQCREKIKKLKAEYKKVKDKRDEMGQGRYPEWGIL